MSAAVEVRDLGKCFRRFRRDRPYSVKQMIFRGAGALMHADTFWALRHIEFDVECGQILGVLGLNGSGKSTLLRLIGGIGRPDEGHLVARGRVTGLLDLGAGFHADLTGRENVFVNGVIAGLTRSEVRARFDSIVDFSELAAAIDYPLHTYSQGMKQRLGFAIAIHTTPDVLLIDEMFAVGDKQFNKKCVERILAFRDDGCTTVLATHNTRAVRKMCDFAIQLRAGEVVAQGAADKVATAYEEDRVTVGSRGVAAYGC